MLYIEVYAIHVEWVWKGVSMIKGEHKLTPPPYSFTENVRMETFSTIKVVDIKR